MFVSENEDAKVCYFSLFQTTFCTTYDGLFWPLVYSIYRHIRYSHNFGTEWTGRRL